MLPKLWTLLHLFFAFSFVGTLILATWIGRSARVTTDWGQRALLLNITLQASRLAGFGPLVLTGVFGNLASVGYGYRMSETPWLIGSNIVWIGALVVLWFGVIPSARALVTIAQAAGGGGPSEGYGSALARWRFGNALLSVLYLSLLVLMVFGSRS